MGWFSRDKQPPFDERFDALQQEYQNYRRRTSQALAQADEQAVRRTVAQFLSVYDDLERALKHACQDEAFYRGVQMIRDNLLSTLASLQVRPMDSLGRCFNPDYHEAVGHVVDSAYREEQIIEVVQTGFTMDEEVIRHAKVIVAN